ncbi:hypothetical protein IMSHALPRED_001933 [Imshaugia aleurites]|uniref:Uncharacterized protein n=1 Tax=Imshaugia aleurites TaxID=172621 RepID=A0A8H3IDJ5_9LECA|nr:hypothetical protein IMSHALPRED_001933 [Imshaugia aleurites]
MLQQMTDLRKLHVYLAKRAYRHIGSTNTLDYYTYQQVFPRYALWPRLAELSISGLAIGGRDLLYLLMGKAKVMDLSLSSIELLDGTWEEVVECLSYRRMTELSLRGSLKHHGGQVFVPDAKWDVVSDLATLRKIEDFVVYGGRHPCLAPDEDPEIANWWYLDMLSDEDFKLWKAFTLQEGREMPMLRRRANVEPPQDLKDPAVTP